MKESNQRIERYARVNDSAEIKRLTKVIVSPLKDLDKDVPELACRRLMMGLKRTFLPNEGVVKLMRSEVERAQAHASLYYADPTVVMGRAYAELLDTEPYMPTCISGPAGVGKTQFRRAMERLLSSPSEVQLGAGHGVVPLVSFTSILVGRQRSVSQIMRPLARPEIQAGRARISEADLPMDCAQWQAITGGCLFGVDELQFLTQSKDASTLVTTVLLALYEVRTPWFFTCNFSLGWKLKLRPPEARQRILSAPFVLLPDPPSSADWRDLLEEYERVAPGVFCFGLVSRMTELWNLSAGLKRLLVELLVSAYRLCRARGALQVAWTDVEFAYTSRLYNSNRGDVEKIIAHAIQGGELKQDLKCPFEDDATVEAVEQYKRQLREARQRQVIAAAIDSSLNVEERARIEDLKSRAQGDIPNPPAKLVKLPKRAKKSVAGLLEAGRRFNDRTPSP